MRRVTRARRSGPSEPEPASEPELDVQTTPKIEEFEPKDAEAEPPSPSSSPSPSSDDPFHGIADSDIAEYSDRFDVPPPENDKEAYGLAEKIRRWIADGRPDPGDDDVSGADDDSEEREEDSQDYDGDDEVEKGAREDHDGGADRNGKKAGQEPEQQDKNDMPKKKRRFGFFRKG